MDSKRTAIRRIYPDEYPETLRNAPGRPDFLYIRGAFPPAGHKLLTVVGSRRYSDYGKEACEALIEGLQGLPVAIVSGLALGIDSIAHRSALKAGLLTIAVPGSGLDPAVMYPASHASLADEMVGAGGALISPFENDAPAALWTFPERNCVMAGISHATLVIEAEIRSGTLITSKHAAELGRDVLAVPGSIFASQSAGPHMLLRLGATPIGSAAELRSALGFEDAEAPRQAEPKQKDALTPEEEAVLASLSSPLPRDEVYAQARERGLSVARTSVALTLLEIKGLIRESGGEVRRV